MEPEQIQTMLELMKEQHQQMQQQMTALSALQEENLALRTAAANIGATGRNTSNNDGDRNAQGQYKSKKPDRPVINAGIDDREWALFQDTWSRYKLMCNIIPNDIATIRLELRAACSTDVNKLLFEFVGATVLDSCTESELLQHIKSVAVKVTHKEVHRMAFDKMVMGQGETVTQFVSRLKAKSFLCQFEITCNACNSHVKQSYAEDRISQRLVAGLSNQEHQRKILAEAESLPTLDAKVKRLQILEMTDESSSMLHVPPPKASEAGAATSQLKKKKKGKAGGSNENREKCKWCGRFSHPGGKSLERVNCPAREMTCFTCNEKGHLRECCEGTDAEAAGVQEEADQLQSIPTEASVSFGFVAEEDFRRTGKKNGRR